MKLDCPSCSTRYTIDDTIIPPLGAKVRCKKCGAVMVVPPTSGGTDSVVPAPTATPVVPSSPPPAPPPVSFGESRPTELPPVSYTAPAAAPELPQPKGGFSFFPNEGPSAAAPAPPPPPPRAASAPSAPSESAAPQVGGPPGTLSAEEKKQHEKARRLARVLASDIAIYNREKKDRGLAEGNLVAVLGYEIKKSWEIYKERVGADFANSTPYFRDALNELLAEGKKIF